MNKGAIQIELDSASFANFQKQMDYLKDNGVKSAYKALCTVALRIRTSAMIHLQSQGHIITSRLKNSIFVKAKNQSDVNKKGNNISYTAKGKSYNADLKSVTLGDYELAVGSNVDYAASIEKGSRPHKITAKNGKALVWKQNAAGKVLFEGAKRAKNYYSDGSGWFTLDKRISKGKWKGMIVVQSVNHPGYKGDSYLDWSLKNVNVSESTAEEMKREMAKRVKK